MVVSFFDRGNLAVSAPVLAPELGLSPWQLGLLLSAFFWSYAACQILAGWLVDRIEVRWVYAGGFLLWSSATLSTAAVASFSGLFCMRLLLGVGRVDHVSRHVTRPGRGLSGTPPRPGELAGGSGSPVGSRSWHHLRRTAGSRHRLARAVCGHRPGRAGLARSLARLRTPPIDSKGRRRPPRRAELVRASPPESRMGNLRRTLRRQLCLVFSLELAALLPGPRAPFHAEFGCHLGRHAIRVHGRFVAHRRRSGRSLDFPRSFRRTVRRGFLVTGLVLTAVLLPSVLLPRIEWAIAGLFLSCLAFGIYASNVFSLTQTLGRPRSCRALDRITKCLRQSGRDYQSRAYRLDCESHGPLRNRVWGRRVGMPLRCVELRPPGSRFLPGKHEIHAAERNSESSFQRFMTPFGADMGVWSATPENPGPYPNRTSIKLHFSIPNAATSASNSTLLIGSMQPWRNFGGTSYLFHAGTLV